MISKQDKQKFFDGEYGVNKAGVKVKYIGKTSLSGWYDHMVATLNEKNEIVDIHYLDDYLRGSASNRPFNDVIGLWQDKPEPFNLERALAGEPVITRDNCKAYVQAMVEQSEELLHYTLIGYGFNGINKEFLHWDKNGLSLKDDISCNDIIGMWKEPQPEPKTVTLTLPCPLKEPTGRKWYVNSELDTPVCKDTGIYDETFISKGCYFATKEDAKAWLDAMKNNRR